MSCSLRRIGAHYWHSARQATAFKRDLSPTRRGTPASADGQGDLSSEEGKLTRSQRKQLMAWSHPSGRAGRPLETDRESGAIDSILKIACASLFPQCTKQTARAVAMRFGSGAGKSRLLTALGNGFPLEPLCWAARRRQCPDPRESMPHADHERLRSGRANARAPD